MAFEWVADCDPSPPKKKRGSSGRRTRGPTSSKISVREEVQNEVPEPNPVYVEFLRTKGIYLESPDTTFGGLDRYLNEPEQPDCVESIGKSAEANVGVELHDPQYLLFIENLRGDGSEVVVEVEPHSGLKEPLRYECEPEKAQRSLEPSLERENDVVEEEKRENDTAKCTRNISGEGERVMSRPAVIKGTSEELCVEVEANDQMELDRENVTCQRTKTGEAEKRVEPSSERKSDEVVELRNLVDDQEGNSDKISRKRKRRENIKEKSVNNDHEEVTDRETKGKAHKKMEPPIEKENARSSKRTEGSSRKESRVVSWDDSYLAFMLCLRGDDDLCIYTNSKKQVKYPEEEEEEKEEEEEVDAESSSSDVEILSPEDPSCLETKMGFVITKSKSSFDAYGEMSQMTPPELREKMIAELKRPYNATEYNNLWEEINIRKPQGKWRDLRGGRERTYQTNETCDSYLEKYRVLQKKVEQLDGNSPAILNLMRGFFFWLKHVPENMFPPWTDPECLKILPPTPADYAPTLPQQLLVHPKARKQSRKQR